MASQAYATHLLPAGLEGHFPPSSLSDGLCLLDPSECKVQLVSFVGRRCGRACEWEVVRIQFQVRHRSGICELARSVIVSLKLEHCSQEYQVYATGFHLESTVQIKACRFFPSLSLTLFHILRPPGSWTWYLETNPYHHR